MTDRPPIEAPDPQSSGFSLRGLEDRALLHVEKAHAAVDAAQDVSWAQIRGDGTPLTVREDLLRTAEVHASLAETVARIISARTKRWRPRPERDDRGADDV